MIHFFAFGDGANLFAITNEQPGKRVNMLSRWMLNNVQMYQMKHSHCFHMSHSHSSGNPALTRVFQVDMRDFIAIGYELRSDEKNNNGSNTNSCAQGWVMKYYQFFTLKNVLGSEIHTRMWSRREDRFFDFNMIDRNRIFENWKKRELM